MPVGTTPLPPSPNVEPGRFVSLRVKFGVFLSLIVVVTCSTLSWYFIQNKRETMTQRLKDIGRVLTKNLASNPRVRYAIITDDRTMLAEFLDGVMAVDDVVYAVISDPTGEPLVARTKGLMADPKTRRRRPEQAVYPDPALARAPLATPVTDPLITYLVASPARPHAVPGEHLPTHVLADSVPAERLYDFALPVVRPSDRSPLPGMPSFESPPMRPDQSAPASAQARVVGLIQVGLTESHLNQALLDAIGTAAWLTLLTILGGVLGIVALTNRIITPLRSLATVARRVTGGDLTASVQPTTRDEIGQLTWLFNNMTQSLKERDEAISVNLSTISNQVRQLTTLNQAGTAIASTLDLDRLLSTLLQLLTDNLGFTRIVVMFFDAERGLARTARVSGVPDAIADAASRLEFPVRDDGSLHAELLLRGKSQLVLDLDAVAHRIPERNLRLLRQVGMTSFVAAPLRSTQRILGYIGADKGAVPCTQEDCDVLTTLASQVAVAIDNARAYRQLGELTASLEQRVLERTQEIQTANVRLKELDKLKSAFVSIVSHELRTPMTAIRGYIDNMLDGLAGPLTDKQVHYLNRVKFNADRLTHMIAELLDLSRIEAGRVELALSELDLRALASDVVDEFQRMASEKGVAIEMRASESLPAIAGDRNKLYQVLTNLIGNAMKFTPTGGRIEVEVTRTEPGRLQVSVSDTGCGIHAEELPRIFEKFFRGSTAPPEARGAGLGLAIVWTLIELHGGRVWVDSTVGVGSRFSFCLPLGPDSGTGDDTT